MTNSTIYDVAKKANVSTATVSRFIHTPSKVSEKIRERVQQAIEELNYSYNAAAANMSKGTTTSIGVLSPSLRDSTFANTLVAIQEQASLYNHYVVISGTKFDAEIERHMLEKFVEQRLGGILIIGYCMENEDFIINLSKSGIKIIVLWEVLNNSLNYVGIDNYAGAKQMMKYLISLNHRNFVFILGQYEKTMRTRSRYNACLDVLNEYSIPYDDDMFSLGLPTIANGYDSMKNFLKKKSNITAVYCNNDLQAVGAIQCIRDHGLRVPEDISVCGFDDIDTAAYLDPPLTTITVPAYEIGEIASRILFENILKNKPIVSQRLEAEMIIRKSCLPYTKTT